MRPCQRLKHALAFRFYPHPRCRAIHRYIPTENASQQCWEAFFKSYPDLSWFRYIIGSPIVNPGQDKSRVSLQRLPNCPPEIRNRCSSVLLRSAGGTIFLCRIEELNRTWKIIVATDAAGGTTFFAATNIRIGCSRPSQQQKLESAAEIVAATAAAGGPFFFDATKISIGRGRSMPLRP